MKESCELYEWLLLMTPVDTLAELERGQSLLYLAVRVPWQSKASRIFDTTMEVLRSIGEDFLVTQLSQQQELRLGPATNTVLTAAIDNRRQYLPELVEEMAELCPSSICCQGPQGATALHVAVLTQNPSILALLLPHFTAEERALPSLHFSGKTARELAEELHSNVRTANTEQVLNMLNPLTKKAF